MFKILIIEDEKVTNDLITYNLKNEGYEVVQAFDGKNATDVLERMKFHLIITDIVMPGKDGYQVLEYLKAKKIDTPVVILSSLSSDPDQINGYDYQIEDYITKPFNIMIISKKINNLIKRIYNYHNTTKLIYDEHVLLVGDEKISFSSKEFDVLEYLYSNKLTYCAKEDIYDYVWEGSEDTSIRVVDYTVKRIRKKLGDHNFIKTKVSVGYKYEE